MTNSDSDVLFRLLTEFYTAEYTTTPFIEMHSLRVSFVIGVCFVFASVLVDAVPTTTLKTTTTKVTVKTTAATKTTTENVKTGSCG